MAVADAAQNGGQAAQTVVSSEAYGGMSEEDRIAVAMAMAEMEAEELACEFEIGGAGLPFMSLGFCPPLPTLLPHLPAFTGLRFCHYL